MFKLSQPRQIIPLGAVILALLFTADIAHEFWINRVRADQIEVAIKDIRRQNRPPPQLVIPPAEGVPMPPPPKDRAREIPDSSSIEIKALGNELKLVNEASWGMILKFCFVWAFTLGTVLVYRIIDRRYA
mgnify:CR=1 FL=1